MLAMERLPPSQPFSTALPLSSPTLQSPRSAGLPPPLCMHGSPVMHPTAALHVSLPGPYPVNPMKPPGTLVHPHTHSSTSLSGVQTPPPYDHPAGLTLSLPGSVFSPPGASQTLPTLSPDRERHHRGHAPDSPRLGPPTSISIPHLNSMTASSSTSSTSTEGSTGSPPGTFAQIV
jgi:hypothetical protein